MWDKYARVPALDERRIAFGEHFFTPTELFQRDVLGRLGSGYKLALELGCGTARNLVFLLHRGSVQRAVGVDISAGALEGALRLARHFGVADRLELIRSDLYDLTAEARYDLVLAVQIINYEPDLYKFFRHVAGVASPSARVLVSDVRAPDLIEALMRDRHVRRLFGRTPTIPSGTGFQVLFHDVPDVLSAARAAGFLTERTEYAFHWTANALLRPMYALSMREFSSNATRRVAKIAYVIFRSLWRWEDRVRSHRRHGHLYSATMYRQ